MEIRGNFSNTDHRKGGSDKGGRGGGSKLRVPTVNSQPKTFLHIVDFTK